MLWQVNHGFWLVLHTHQSFLKLKHVKNAVVWHLSVMYTVQWILNNVIILFFFSFHAVLYLGFAKWEDQIVLDESDKGNNAFLSNGAFIAPHRGACGHFASLGKRGDIILEDTTFRGKPRTAITVASWVNLPGTTRGSHSVFSTARVMRIGQVMGKHTNVLTYGWSPDRAFMTKSFHTNSMQHC